MIFPINTKLANLNNSGGKGVNLVKLAAAGFNVPAGFIIGTNAYHEFVSSNRLETWIIDQLMQVDLADPKSVQGLSQSIRERFKSTSISPELICVIHDAYAAMESPAVTVRSTATTEDLPEMSFAGQQDTLLNILGPGALIDAVLTCWSSLWTARAISYRNRNNVPQDTISLAVVVQEMVQSEASGVLFTANPLTGLRSEIIIDATLGLGEALVGGHVEPDHYVVDATSMQILQKEIGAKAKALRGLPGGGTEWVKFGSDDVQAITDEQIMSLADLGARVESIYAYPQDIEWAWAGGELYVLQTRPITSLYPIPDGMQADPLTVMFSFAAIQGLMEPISPLGQDAIRLIFVGGASLFGLNLDQHSLGFFHTAGERLWGDMAPALRNPIGRKLLPKFFSAVEIGIVRVIEILLDDPRLAGGRVRLSTLRRLAKFLTMMMPKIIHNLRNPEGAQKEIRANMKDRLDEWEERSVTSGDKWAKFSDRVKFFHEINDGFVYAVPEIATAIVAAFMPFFGPLRHLVHGLPNDLLESSRSDLHMELTRGLPYNVTTEMDLALWEVACKCEGYDPESRPWPVSS